MKYNIQNKLKPHIIKDFVDQVTRDGRRVTEVITDGYTSTGYKGYCYGRLDGIYLTWDCYQDWACAYSRDDSGSDIVGPWIDSDNVL